MLGNVVRREVVVGGGSIWECARAREETPQTWSFGGWGSGATLIFPRMWSLSLQKPPAESWLYSIVCDREESGPSATSAGAGGAG